jgi:HEAT repeat protein
MESRRLVNDFPEVRREAARQLGSVGTPEAKSALIRITTTDREPMVLQEAIKSLGMIGLNENDETVNAIVWVVSRFDFTTAPDNLLALSAVDALDRIAEKNNGISNTGAIQLLIRIAEGPYSLPVRERARQALVNLRRYAVQGAGQGNASQ